MHLRRQISFVAILGCIAACGDGAPSCKDAVGHAAGRFGNGTAPEVATLIGTCEQAGWSSERRGCFAGAQTADALQACLPALDVKLPVPTLAPSPATVKLVADGPGDVRALLFFSDHSETAALVESYFKQLGKIAVEHHDRVKDGMLARTYHARRDGTIVLVRGDRQDSIELPDDLEHALRSPALRDFDAKVAHELARLSRPQPKAYLVAGHGEMTDRASLPVSMQPSVAERKTSMLVRDLVDGSFQVARLGDELAVDVPADATVVLVFAPAIALTPAEQAALERYLDRGGALLYALDPTVEPGLGALEAKLGVRFDHGHLTDDKKFYPRLRTAADHRDVMTNEFTPHPTVNSVDRSKRGLLLIDSGTLEASPTGDPPPKVTFTIRSMDTSFIDVDNNFELTPGIEKRGSYNVAAAIEGAKFRALVFADTDLFEDVYFQAPNRPDPTIMMVSDPLFTDSLRWLSRQDEMAPVAYEADSSLGKKPLVAARLDGPTESKALLAAELELAERRVARAQAAVLAAGPLDHDKAEHHVQALQIDEADLRARLR